MAGWQCYMNDEHYAAGRGGPPPPGYYGPQKDPNYDADHPVMTVEPISRPQPAPQPAPYQGRDPRIAQAYKQIQNVGAQFEQHRQQIEGRRADYVDNLDRMRDDVNKFAYRPETQADLDGAVQLAATVRDEAVALKDTIRAAMIPARDAAGELRAQRQWARHEKLLDSAGSVGQRAALAQQIVASITDPGEFAAVACEELKPYLRTKGDPTEWLEDRISRRVPLYAEAVDRAAKAEKQLVTTRFNVDQQRRALAKGRAAGHLVDP
jgi:hypothetical protein